jgi:hypothetical protein
MSRRSLFFAVGILACLLCAAVGVVIAMVRCEPEWYRGASAPAGPQRLQLSQDFWDAFTDLKAQVDNEREWGKKFDAKTVNAWFEEGLYQINLDADLARSKISQPRVVFEQDRVRLGFRYGKGIWSTVISMALRVWVPKEDSSAVVLELESLQAGALPVSAQSVLEEISRVLREKDLEINWYRINGHPAAVLRFQTDQQHPPVQLTAINSKEGELLIQGRTNDPSQGPPPPAAGPAANP